MRSIVRIASRGKRRANQESTGVDRAAGLAAGLNSRVELIQVLIPLGLEAVNDLLQKEVTALAGKRRIR